MITKYIVGDITQTELKYIAHGVNCQNKMGSGVAKALYEKFPIIKESYHSFVNNFVVKEHQRPGLLGMVDEVVYSKDKRIFNMFTQYNYGYDNKRYVNYAAIVKCFESLKRQVPGQIVAIPKIGCGLAGGNWTIVEQLINDTIGDDLEIWVYELDNSKLNGLNDLG